MASNRAKLSLRRPKKAEMAPPDKLYTASRDAGPTPPAPTSVEVEVAPGNVGGVSRPESISVPSRDEEERGRQGPSEQLEREEEEEEEEFRPQPNRVGRKRRQPQNETERYVDDEEQLQLAKALSASLHPASKQDTLLPPLGKRGKRGRGRANERDLPLSTVVPSAVESERMLAQKVSAMLETLTSSRSSVPSGPGPPSQLGQSARGSSTLWDMAGYTEREEGSKFVVPALDLPPSQSHSSPSSHLSPVPHSHTAQSLGTTCPPQPAPRPPAAPPPRPPQPAPPPPRPPAGPPALPPGVKTLLSDLASLVGSQLCSDVIITAGDGRGIPSHSAILACRCPILAERLFHSLDKPVYLDFSQYDRTTVVSFLRYLYTGIVPNQNGTKAVKMLAMSLGMGWPSEELHGPSSSERASSEKQTRPASVPASQQSNREALSHTLTALQSTPHHHPPSPQPPQPHHPISSPPPPQPHTPHHHHPISLPQPHTPHHHHPISSPPPPQPHTPHHHHPISSPPPPQPHTPHHHHPISSPPPPQPHTPHHHHPISLPQPHTPHHHHPISLPQPHTPHHHHPISSPPPPQPHTPHHHHPISLPQPHTPHHHHPISSPPPPQPHTPHHHHPISLPQPHTPHHHHPISLPQPHTPHHHHPISLPQPHTPHHHHPISSPPPPQPHAIHQTTPQDDASEIMSSPSSPNHSPTPPVVVVPTPQTRLSLSQPPSPSSSPLPLRERISCSLPISPVGVATTSHDDQQPSSTSDHSKLVTPAPLRQKPVLESDTDITPIPDYRSMATPHLKDECSRFGVRALPKKKMIAKLTEIYDYTHPLTDADGNIVTEEPPPAAGPGKRGGREKPSLEELVEKVREVITKDTELYEQMLLYKPLELSHIQTRLKTAAAISLSRDTLMDVLDQLCVTFTVPRQQNQQQKN